ncbi:MAG: sodium-dependent transporter [Woeseia sp.]
MTGPAAAEFEHETWSSRRAFLLAAIGSAVGLGNIWRFPYITGINGGGAFVIVYCLCILVIAIPLLMAELAIGRRGGQSPIRSMQRLTAESGRSRAWHSLGWLSIITPTVGLMYYSVVAGWTLDYAISAASGTFSGYDAKLSGEGFSAMAGNPVRMMVSQAGFVLLIIAIVLGGVRRGLERAVKYLMPGLALILVVLVIFAAVTADFSRALKFMFEPDFSKLTSSAILMAIGQAFFSVNVAVGALITYGAYMPREVSIPRVSAVIAFADTGVALMMGLVIFPLVFSYGLQPGEGPGLVFVTLPIAFGQMPFGAVFGTLFFLLMAIAAITSGIGMLEPSVSRLEELKGFRRVPATILMGGCVWLFGLLALFSFNVLAGFTPLDHFPLFEGKGIFDLFDFVTANVLIPAGGLLIALFAGWMMTRESVQTELGLKSAAALWLWRSLVRIVAPVAKLAIFAANLFGS